MEQLTLTEIWIYPIKSLPGISLQDWEVKRKGMRYDRRWMLIDDDGVFLTQRTIPQLALFKTSLIHGDHLTIQHSSDSINLYLDTDIEGDYFTTKIWDDVVDVIEVDKIVSSWFSEKLGMKCKLVSFPEKNKREVESDYSVGHEVSLADGYPFLIIGEKTLDDLNTRLAERITMRRFRPNFVFSGGAPFVEDTWQNFSIGSVDFIGVKPCARCVLTTVDPDTGMKGAEPLKTLATYRAENNKILFGQNLVTLNEGRIKIGDKLQIK